MTDHAESYIEQTTCEYAEDYYELLAIKLSSQGTNGLPDRLFVGPRRLIFFIEFKAFGEEPSKLQAYYIKLIRMMGFKVYVVDEKESGKKIINKEAARYSIKKKRLKKSIKQSS